MLIKNGKFKQKCLKYFEGKRDRKRNYDSILITKKVN